MQAAFSHKGFSVFSVPEEEEKDWKNKFDEWQADCASMFGRPVLALEGSEIKVDWPIYLKTAEIGHGERLKSNAFLRQVGILSYRSEKNFAIINLSGQNMNPWSEAGNLYFTREKDVLEFAELKFGKTVYGWIILEISRVIYRHG